MKGRPARRLMLGVALAALLAGVLIAVFAGGGHHGRAGARASGRSDVQLAADYLGVSVPALRRELRAGTTMAAVAEETKGRSRTGLIEAVLAPRAAALRRQNLTPAEERRQLAHVRARILAEVGRARHHGGTVAVAATYLGIDEARLRARLRTGATLAQIAQSTSGRSTAGLIDALVGARRRAVDAAVRNGTITRRQQRAALTSLRIRLTSQVHRRLLAE
jgi:hypothetical protein